MVDSFYLRLMIADERATINHYARSIGIWKQMIERETDETQRQYFEYFRDVDIIEMENSNERLEKYRSELTDYELSQG